VKICLLWVKILMDSSWLNLSDFNQLAHSECHLIKLSLSGHSLNLWDLQLMILWDKACQWLANGDNKKISVNSQDCKIEIT